MTHSDELEEEKGSHTEDSSSTERTLAFTETSEEKDNGSKVNYENYRNKTRERLYRKEAEDKYARGPETPQLYWPPTDKNSQDSTNEILDRYNKETKTYQDDGNGSREKKIQELINRLEVKKGRHPMNEKQYAKVQEAIDLIKNNGNTHFRSYADNLQQMLKDGKIYMDENLAKGGEGKKGTAAETGNGWPLIKGGDIKFNPAFLDENGIRNKWEVAGILIHENKHRESSDQPENKTYREQFDFLKDAYGNRSDKSTRESKDIKEALQLAISHIADNKKVDRKICDVLSNIVLNNGDLNQLLKNMQNNPQLNYLTK
ncbi:MAG: hypothetical protein AB2L14_23665 [Candidatus Xenobiia bacterium LiM19]